MSSRKKPYVVINDNLDELDLIDNSIPRINTNIVHPLLPQKELRDLENSKISSPNTGPNTGPNTDSNSSIPAPSMYDGGSRRRKRHSRRRRHSRVANKKSRKIRRSRRSRRHHRRR